MLRAARIAPNPQRLDVINGSAGLITALLHSAEHGEREELLESAVRHGEHLVNMATRMEQGWSWDTLGLPNERHLLGFAHGASGIAYALAMLAAASARQDFLDAAQEALRYERAHFRPAEDNWPDLRSFVQPGPAGEPPCMLAWCHGAPGIGFARLLLHKLMPNEPSILAEAEVAIRITSATLGEAAPGIGNFSLCHGDFGNADLLGTWSRPTQAAGAAPNGRGRWRPGARSLRRSRNAMALRCSERGRNAQPPTGVSRNWLFFSSPV